MSKKKKKKLVEAGDIVPQVPTKSTNSQLRKKKPENLLDTTSLHRNDNLSRRLTIPTVFKDVENLGLIHC